MKAVRFRVTGLVQGVGFRAWVHRVAVRLKVAGWVRNTPDGAVEGHAEGDEADILHFLDALRSGPCSARVGGLDLDDAPAESHPRFEIRR